MFKFILYALLFLLVIQMIRTTTRLRSNAKQARDDEEEKHGPKKPVINIPDIQDARFEDITGKEEDEKPGDKRDGPPPH